jgi:GR25 family glycosyltransferase involved in LPS biosynthesis
MLRSSSVRRSFAAAAYPFDAVYVLNLDRRTDRWAHTQQQLRRAGLHKGAERVSGVDGLALDTSALQRQGLLSPTAVQRLALPLEEKLFGMDLTPGAIGCAMGHRKLWELVVERKHECALLLEDDVEFNPALKRAFAERWAAVPKDWGILYLGGLDLLAKGKPPRPFLGDGVRYAYQGHRELTAYVVHHRSAQRCLDLSREMTWQIDTHICNNFAHDAAAQDDYIADPLSYVLQPSLAIQLTKFGTDVQKQEEHNPALMDASRRMREFVGGGTSVR